MPPWTSATCATNAISIHYTRSGGNGPPVVLLHGLSASGACWTLLARDLESGYDVIMPDARGHGGSSAPADGYRYEDLANDAAGLIQALGLPAPVLVGHSMGGMTAALVAARRPGLLRGLVLADPSFLGPELQRQVRDSDVADQHRRYLDMSLDEVMADGRARHPQRPAELVELLARARLQTSLRAFDLLQHACPDYMELARAIDVPTLLVIAENGVVTPETAAQLQSANPRIQVEKIANAGHGLHYDQPERFAAVVRAFLESVNGKQ